ncbi:MAG: hypothetical protein HPY82_06645 [Gammaproteobacteria bacterium]|nr:hypothetical protein [Gammaproteobacteria bacterium]
MHQQRFDIYRLIHKGLRAYLTETLLAVGRMDLDASADLHAGLTQLHSLLDFCESHLQHENTFIHPAMNLCQPGSADSMSDHHQQHVAMIAELRGAARQLRACAQPDRELLAAQLYRKLALFVADNLAHMHEEETRNNSILWNCYSDAEIQAIHQAILQSIPPQENAVAMHWMLAALNHQERHALLSGMRREAPQPVFENTLAIAQQNLPRSEWNKLQFALAC